MALDYDSNIKNPYYLLEQEYIPIPGTSVRIVLEFPEITKDGKSLIFHLDDTMTISYSVYRSKIRVVPLGRSDIVGYGLGTRLVAGSMIRSVFSIDKLTKLQEDVYYANQEQIKQRLLGIDGKIPKGLPKEDVMSYMKDDLTSFNIHMTVQSEELTKITGDDNKSTYTPYTRYEVIMGCIAMNSGQVFSVEDLITETTISFEAKNIKTITNLNKNNYSTGFSNGQAVISGSSLL